MEGNYKPPFVGKPDWYITAARITRWPKNFGIPSPQNDELAKATCVLSYVGVKNRNKIDRIYLPACVTLVFAKASEY